MLAKRLELLQDVQRLQDSLDVQGDQAYTCETAGHFFLYQVLARWERFLASVKRVGKKVGLKLHFLSSYCLNQIIFNQIV